MAEIKCPHCKKIFSIEKDDYNSLIEQVKNSTFKEEVEQKVQEQIKNIKLENDKKINEYQNQILAKENEIEKISFKYENRLKEYENNSIKEKVKIEKEIASKKDSEISELKKSILEQDQIIKSLKKNEEEKIKFSNLEYIKQIDQLKNQLTQKSNELENQKERLENKHNSEIFEIKKEIQNKHQKEIEKYEEETKNLKEEIDRQKNFRLNSTTKMVGESLEQFCQDEYYNNIQKNLIYDSKTEVKFGKDNDASEGSKGDFVFKEIDKSTNEEILSIMFEMKNYQTDSSNRKNEEFFKKLDKDRNIKKCEYAVLVTMLEPNNGKYDGIVDVSISHPEFKKMYVVRPQWFISIIQLLRKQAYDLYKTKQQYLSYEQTNIDKKKLENDILNFKESFTKSVGYAKENFITAVKRIDSAIKVLEEMRENFRKAGAHLTTAVNKLDNLTMKKLAKGNKTLTNLINKEDGEEENNDWS
ncbi:DUF2130 domain-containing protein [Metamycoplasma hyosynoviae]|uniref:DUF2130 domain-containing protein n=1 Tax=Metamycoplasma hyosynoviae TaxID=29559 RepID=UPI00249C2DD4|nr:DUF2130 domain-containing protein [Metamycoplasma hyosynoviae]MDI3063898.1 DUF2130 domain-containing protein [Metamycoplasma hyosynoviae]